MKKLIRSKPVIIVSSIILLALFILLYIKSGTDYSVAIMGSLINSDNHIVKLDMNKKVIIETATSFKLDNKVYQAIVSADKKHLVYTGYTNGLYNEAYVKNLDDGTINKIVKHDEASNIRNVKWIDENTLLYLNGNTLYTMNVSSMRSQAVKLPGNSIKLAAIYYPKNKGFIVCINNQNIWGSQIDFNNFENDLYMIDSKGGNEKLLKKFKNIYITSMILMPKAENILMDVVNHPDIQSQFLYPDIYLYNIKSGSFKLILKHKNDSASFGIIPTDNNIFPYNQNNFLYQYKYKLYNVNIQTGKSEQFNFRNQKPDEYLYSFTGAE